MMATIRARLLELDLRLVTLTRSSKTAHKVVQQEQEEGQNEYPGDTDQIILLHDAYSVTSDNTARLNQ